MAKTIPQLTDATTVNAADELIIQQGGITKRATGAELAKGLNAINGTVNVKDFGAVGDGVADDTAAIQAALNSTAREVVFPSGTYRVQSASETSSTPALTSSVDDRIICGAGTITATTRVRKLLEVTGDRSRVSLNIDGNQNIGHAIDVAAEDCAVTDCHIYDLDGLTDWTATAISFSLEGLDTSGLVSSNIIKNLQAAGDGVGGNGVGMSRAIGIYSDQNCTKQVLVTGNVIEAIEGEEGDSIVVAAGGSANPLTLPVTVANNTVNLWTRRAVKIQASGVTVLNNTFSNDRVTAPDGLQRVVDVTAGSNIVVQGNTFQRCKHQAQIAAFLNSPQAADNILVSGNTIYGLGAETTSDIFVFRTYGTNVNITGNTIVCPNYNTVAAIDVRDASQVTIANNTVVMTQSTGVWYSLTNVTQTRIFGNVTNGKDAYQQYIDYNAGGEHVVDVTSGGARSVTLYNADTAVSDGELIAMLSCRQNDTSSPDGLHASVQFVGEGSSGNTGIRLHTGSNLTPNTEKLAVRSNGNVGIGVTPTSKLHVDGDITVSNATTATTATAGARTLPANPEDFLVVSINGTSRKIPYYAT